MDRMTSPKVDEYLAELTLTKTANTIESAKQILAEYLRFSRPTDIRAGILDYLAWCKKKGNSDRTLAHKRVRVLAYYRWLGYSVQIPPIKVRQEAPEAFTRAELDKMLACAGKHQLLLEVLLKAGLRSTEASKLTFGDVVDHGLIVRAAHAKSGRTRVVVTPQGLIEALREKQHQVLGRPEDRIFLMNRHRILLIVKRIAKRAGLDPEKAWSHKWRATYATTLLHSGLDVNSVRLQLGHSTLGPTMRYLTGLEDSELQAKVSKVWAK